MARASLRSRWRVRSLRFRILAATGVVAALALTVALGGYGLTLQVILDRTVTVAATDQANQLAALIADTGVDPSTLLEDVPTQGSILQLVDESGTVLSANDDDAKEVALSDARPAVGEVSSTRLDELPTGEDDPHVVVVRGLEPRPEMAATWLVVATPLQDEVALIEDATLALGTLALILLAGLLWLMSRVITTALGRVEQIRASVARIRETRSDVRVPVPPGDDEITHLAQTMNDMLDRLHRVDAVQRSFISDASHELRSPLTAIRMISETSPRGIDASGSAVVGVEAARMQRLVDDLLTLAKADDQGIALRAVPVDLDDVLTDELHRLQATTTLRIEDHITGARVLADPDRLAQIVRNLADNAARHACTSVRLGSRLEGSDAVITLDNDGDLIPVDQREAIFDRFARLQDARDRDSGGSGLGLAIVLALTQAHGGTVVATQAPDGWCRFEVRLSALR